MAGDPVPHVRMVSVVAAGLGEELGLTVNVEPNLREIPVLVDEPGQSAGRRLEDLAFALHASLVRDGKAVRIERSTDDLRAVKAIHRARLRAEIEWGFADREQALRKLAALGDEEAQMQAAAEAYSLELIRAARSSSPNQPFRPTRGLIKPDLLEPGRRLAYAVLRRIDLDTLSDFSAGEVKYFSDHPNSAELPLPEYQDLMRSFLKVRPAKSLLRLSETGATLQVFDSQGREISSGTVPYIDLPFGCGRVRSSELPLRTLDKRSWEMVSLIQGDSEGFSAAMVKSQQASGLLIPPPAPTVPEAFLYPERDDPLDFAVRDGILSVPPLPKSAGIVAVLADDLVYSANSCCRDGQMDLDSFLEELFLPSPYEQIGFERFLHQGVTVLRPRDPLSKEYGLTKRTVLGPLVRRIISARRVDFRSWAAVMGALYPAQSNVVADVYLGALSRIGLPNTIGIGIKSEILALAGAAEGKRHNVVDAAQSPLREMIWDGLVHGWLKLAKPNGGSDLEMTPTALEASGALATAEILVETSVEVVADDGDEDYGFAETPISQKALELYPPDELGRSDRRTKQLFEQKYLKPRYRVGRMITSHFELRLGQRISYRIEFADMVLDRVRVPFAQLPPRYQNEILARVADGLRAHGASVPRLWP